MPWPFPEHPNAACITCDAVLNGAPILLVTHYDDGAWAFLDGEPLDEADAYTALLQELLTLHPDLDAIADLPKGWTAYRETELDAWERVKD
ncbi:MAG: hypothetical protein U1E50_08230 [Caulobacteraceae bacterium]